MTDQITDVEDIDLDMTDDEIKAEFVKIQAQKAKQREYMSRPEVRERMKEYQRERAAKRKAVLARAAELGLEADTD